MYCILSFKIVYVMPENGLYYRILLDVLTRLIKFVVVDGSIYVEFNMIHRNRMNFTKKCIIIIYCLLLFWNTWDGWPSSH